MIDDLEKQINALVAECETALSTYADKTGANMQPEVVNQGLHLRVPSSGMSAEAMLELAEDLHKKTEAAAQKAADLDSKMLEAANELARKKAQRDIDEAARREQARAAAQTATSHKDDTNRAKAKKKLSPIYDGPISLGRVGVGSRRRTGH